MVNTHFITSGQLPPGFNLLVSQLERLFHACGEIWQGLCIQNQMISSNFLPSLLLQARATIKHLEKKKKGGGSKSHNVMPVHSHLQHRDESCWWNFQPITRSQLKQKGRGGKEIHNMSNKQYSKSNRKINGVQQSSELFFRSLYPRFISMQQNEFYT